MHKWGLTPSPNCDCRAIEQTANHVFFIRPIHRAQRGICGQFLLHDDTRGGSSLLASDRVPGNEVVSERIELDPWYPELFVLDLERIRGQTTTTSILQTLKSMKRRIMRSVSSSVLHGADKNQ